MIRAREDRWFDRYRRNGDPRLLARVFDRTAPELWKVAAHLCRDRHAVEDAVQGTFLVAIEARQTWDASRPLLPWLLGLLVNRVRDLRRRTRSPDAERLAPSAGEADPAQLAETAELQRGLLTTLQRVAEPYRSTLERHLLRGEGAVEIATAIGVPAGTVRMRLHRGLELLRERLPAGFAGGGAVLVLTSESFAAMRRTVLGSAPGGVAVGAAAGAGAGHFLSVWLGVMLMNKTTMMVAGALLAGVLAWWGFDLAKAAPEPRFAVQTTTRPLAAEVQATNDAEPLANEAVAPAAVRVPAAAGPARGVVRVVLVRQDDRLPIPEVSLELLAGLPATESGAVAVPQVAHGRTEADGAASFRVPAGRCEVRSVVLARDREPWQAEVLPGQETELRIEVPIRVRAEVQVVDSNGRPVAGAQLVGRTVGDVGEVVENELGRTDAMGWWRAALVESHVPIRALRDGYVASPAGELTEQRPTARLVLGDGPGGLAGTVFGRDGRPLPKAQVLLQPHQSGFAGERPLAVVADGGGGFRFAHVPPGPCTVLAVSPIGVYDRRWARAAATVVAGQEQRVDVSFPVGASIVVSMRAADGTPVQDQHVAAVFQPEPQLWLYLSALGSVSKQTDARGVAVFEDLAAGEYEVQAFLPEGAQRSKVRVAPGEPVQVDWHLGPTSFVAVELVDGAGQALVDWRVSLQPDSGIVKEARSDARGMVRFEPIRAPAGQLVVRAPGSEFVVLQQRAVVGEPTRLVITAAQTATGLLRGRGQLTAGLAASDVSIQLVRMRGGEPGERVSGPLADDGTFAFPGLPAGLYMLGFLRGQRELLGTPRQVEVQPGAEVDLGEVELTPAAAFAVEVLAADGGAVQQPRLFLAMRERPRDFGPVPQQRSGAVCTVPGMPDGRFELLVWGEDVAPTCVPIEVSANTRRLPVTAARGVPTRFVVRGVARGDWTLRLQRDGTEMFAVRWTENQPLLGLAPGNYRAEVTCGQRSGTAEFSVGDASSTVEIVVPE